jgi:hypothetical protein
MIKIYFHFSVPKSDVDDSMGKGKKHWMKIALKY